MIDTEILQDYAGEARELLDEMDHSLIRLEKEGGTSELLNNIFRAVHCIKGSAEYIGLERSSTLTHGVENLLDRLREGIMQLDGDIVDFLFRAKDLIQRLIQEVSQEHEEKAQISAIMAELEGFLTGNRVPKPEATPAREEELSPPISSELPSPAVTEDMGEYSVALKIDEEYETSPGGSVKISTLIVEQAALEPEDSLGRSLPLDDTQFEDLAPPEQPSSLITESDVLDESVRQLLNISLYLDDLQDGLKPAEVLSPLRLAVDDLCESFRNKSIMSGLEILKRFQDELDQYAETTDGPDLDRLGRLRGNLYELKRLYPEGKFPLQKPRVLQDEYEAVAAVVAPTPAVEPKVSVFQKQLEKVPGITQADIDALEGAGFSSIEQIARSHPGALANVPGMPSTSADLLLKFLRVPKAPEGKLAQPKSDRVSMMADIDDDLLNAFEKLFRSDDERADSPERKPATGRAQDLLEGVGVIGEDQDREIIEIFLSYGWEILDKIRPQVDRVRQKIIDKNDLDACVEHIKSIRSSSSYMDYQNLAAFLEDWQEKAMWAVDNVDSLTSRDLEFMEASLLKFQDFLRGVEFALNPQLASVVRASETPSPPKSAEAPQAIIEPEDVSLVADLIKQEAPETLHVETIVEENETLTVGPVQEVHVADAQPIEGPPALVDETSDRQSAFAQDPGGDGREHAVVRTMRVDSAKVDTLLNQVGELVVNRSYVEQLALELKHFHRSLMGLNEITKKEIQAVKDLGIKVGEASISLGRVATDLQEGVMKLRMLPVGQLFNRMPRLIRDLSRRVGKSVALDVNGGDTEVDKRVIEQIYNPLVHLIRNAVDHGIEDIDTRAQLGKPAEGSITLSAYSQGNQVVIDVEDDGGGINREAVIEKAVQSRVLDAQDAKGLGAQEIYNLLFLPGFSTSKKVTRTSGRGVGMDVVKKDVEKINGHVEIESWENQGTRISIKIPLTLAIIQTLLIRSGTHVYAVPLTSVREILQVSPSEITTIEGFEVIKFRDETIPVLRISEIFRLRGNESSTDPRFLVLTSAGPKSVGFLVEELIGEQDVVIKPLAEHVCESRGLAGSTILGDGTIALVIDVLEVMDDVVTRLRQLIQSGAQPFFGKTKNPDELQAGGLEA